ncbi:MAG: hypothetical protein CMH30_07010 [Micavibrio sp.]|nr:hypothetical protein [Micavibrio sp.]|tara:strand:+ start:677 stop:1078 length:402 start_codon:yes stop_codon:yes gene_type:complete
MKLTPAFCLGMIVTVFLGVSLFVISQENQKQRDVLSTLNKSLQAKQEHRLTLEAEWAYLNKPERLEKMMATLNKTDVGDAPVLAQSNVMEALPVIALILPPPSKPAKRYAVIQNAEPVKDIAMVLSQLGQGVE